MKTPELREPPAGAGIFRRPRVNRLISDSVSSSALTLIIAPRSFGKSTAATHWATENQDREVHWLDAADFAGQGWHFYGDLVLALASSPNGAGLASMVGNVEGLRPLRRMSAVLGRELARRGAEAVVVVNRAELLDAEAQLILRSLSDRCPGIRFILLAASLDPIFVQECESQGATLLGVKELEVSPEEIEQAITEAGLRTEPAAFMEMVTTPLMLRSVIQYVTSLGEDVITVQHRHRVGLRLASRLMYRVLAEYSLGSTPKPLLLFSLSGTADAELLIRISGISHQSANAMLQDLTQRAMGEWGSNGLFCMDESLTQGLAAIAAKQVSPTERRDAHRVIAVWMNERGRTGDALRHAELAEDWDLIGRIMLGRLSDLPQHDDTVLLELLRRAPADALRRSPWLGWQRLHMLAGSPGVSYAELQQVGNTVFEALAPEAQGLELLMQEALRFGVRQLLGDYEGADAQLDWLLSTVENLPNQPGGEFPENSAESELISAFQRWGRTALRQSGASGKLLMGDHQAALELIEPLILPQEEESDTLPRSSLYCAGLKALTLSSSGDIREALRVISWTRSFRLPEGWDASRAGLPLVLAEIYVAMAQQRRETAKALLAGIPHRYEMTLDLWPFIYELRARGQYYYGDDEGWQALAAALRARPDQPPASRYWQQGLWGRVGGLAVMAGDRETAEAYIQQMEAMDYPGRRGAVLERAQLNLHMEFGEYETVRELAQKLLQRQGLNFREEIQARISLAASLHALGVPESAGEQLRLTLNLADDSGLLFEALHMARGSIREMVQAYAPERAPMLRILSSERGSMSVPELTESERRVLQLLAIEESRTVIAQRLRLSVNTVKTHLRHLYRKLDAGSRPEALERAYALQLLPL